MKEKIGVLKDIDKLGRIVIPKEYRERLRLDTRVELVLTTDGVLIRNPEYSLIKIITSGDDIDIPADKRKKKEG
jgi:AbrB family looped-hinge helix DNA binding protein|nr:AbrB family transcriptional regulator [Clostridia bacterium]